MFIKKAYWNCTNKPDFWWRLPFHKLNLLIFKAVFKYAYNQLFIILLVQ